MNKSHYDTLGVSKTASTDEIKQAFRKISMATHPDVANNAATSCTATTNTEKFKQASEAYRILSNARERRQYDYQVEEATRFGPGPFNDRAGGSRRRAPGGNGRPTTAVGQIHQVLDTIYRPRNLFLTMTVGFMGVVLIKSIVSPREKRIAHGKTMMVEAWKNPTTNQWETPTPWDPTYRRLKPKLTLVPREQVVVQHNKQMQRRS